MAIPISGTLQPDGNFELAKIEHIKGAPQKTKNLFNKATAKKGYFIAYDTGNENVSQLGTLSASDFIEVVPGQTYFFTEIRLQHWACYNENKVFAGQQPTGEYLPNPWTCPEGVSYIRVSPYISTLDAAQMEVGNTGTSYVGYGFDIPNKVDSTMLTKIPKKSKNMFNKNTALQGYYISYDTGAVTLGSLGTLSASDFIEVVPGQTYSFTEIRLQHWACYNANKVFVGEQPTGQYLPDPWTCPEGVSYIRVSPYISTLDAAQMEVGAVKTPYEPYGYIAETVNVEVYPEDIVGNVINVPSKIREFVATTPTNDYPVSIYLENIINKPNSKEIVITCSQGVYSEEKFTGDITADRELIIELYKNSMLVGRKASKIEVKSPGDTTTDFVLHFIGDSTTLRTVLNCGLLFTADADSDATFIGTRYDESYPDYLHDGRPGWATFDFLSTSEKDGYTNPFKNPATGVFDYDYYVTQQSSATPTHVVFNLGINDITGAKSVTALKTAVTTAISNLNTMIASVKAFNANIKICIMLPIAPNISQEAFWTMLQTSRWLYKRNYDYLVSEYIKAFDRKEADGTYVIATNIVLDPETDLADALHAKTDTGYPKIGLQCYKFFKVTG